MTDCKYCKEEYGKQMKRITQAEFQKVYQGDLTNLQRKTALEPLKRQESPSEYKFAEYKLQKNVAGFFFAETFKEEGMINQILPYPPSANRYWRKTNRGVIYLSAEAKEYKKQVAAICQINVLKGDLRLSLVFYRPKKVGDLSNRIKVLEDAMQGIFYDDDKQIVEIHAYRFDDKTNPRVEVDIKQMNYLS